MAGKRRRRKALPQEPVTARIDAFSHDGRGIAYVEGKAVFIDAAIPGETVEFVYTDIRRDYAEGRVVKQIQAAAERIEPQCPHFSVCGGCSLQHMGQQAQIAMKQDMLVDQFRRIGRLDAPELFEPMTGPQWGYRHKARMGVKYVAKKRRVLVGFRERRNPFLAEIDECIVMHPSVGLKLTALGEMIEGLSIRDRIPQIEVAVGDQDCVLSIRVLDPPNDADRERMQQFAAKHNMIFYLQPKGPSSIEPLWPEHPVMPSYALPELDLEFNFRPAMFTQVNTEINRKMVSRVLEIMQLNEQDKVLDLFCGLGNFTLPLARKAGHVTGVEVDQPLIEHARDNARHNGIDNVDFFSADLSGDITGMSWAKQRYSKILLDPSRAGAAEVIAHIPRWQPELIVYVSCNPSTLARDAGLLVNEQNYRLVRAGVMDMFPQTAHVESIAVFART